MDCKVICVVAGLFTFSLVSAGPVIDDDGRIDNAINSDEHSNVEGALLKKMHKRCTEDDVSSCMMFKLITYFNRMLKKSFIEIGDVEITQTSIGINDEARSLKTEHMSEEAQITAILSNKAINFMKTRSLRWKILDQADLIISGGSNEDDGLSVGFSLRPSKSFEGRRRKNNNMGALIAAAALKIGLLKALAFKALALLVGKALLVSKIALVLAAIIGLKKLFSSGKHVTYEVVAHPHHEAHHEHSFSSGGGHDSYGGGGGGGWGRNYEAGNLAYKAHVPHK